MIHIIHTMGGCGGTILSRCIGVLPRVALLSEINPAAVKLFATFDPLYQDRNWTHLLRDDDLDRLSRVDYSEPDGFRDLIATLHARCVERGRILVLRDYNYIDFVGVPFRAHAPRRLTIYEALPQNIPTTSAAFLRHPVDQWASLCKHDIVREALTPSWFCDSYAAFVEALGGIPKHRYEEFAADPDAGLRSICDDLNLTFDPAYRERFHEFDFVTGDFTRHQERSISAPERRTIPAHVLMEFRRHSAYDRLLAAAGYRAS